jgi:hypothetical protein
MAASMPAYIRRAEVRKEHVSLPIMAALKKHALVISAWQDMKSVVKAAMISNPNMFIRITSDREIRDVYVGSKSRAARGDEEGSIYNSLEDLMEPPSLCIVRLNELSYKNKAAPGALEEAICYRIDRDKPTWLYSDCDRPFTVGSHAYSDSIADVIKTNFPIVRIPRILPSINLGEDLNLMPEPVNNVGQSQNDLVITEPMPLQEDVVDGVLETSEVSKTASKPKTKVRIKPSTDEDADTGGLSLYGSGLNSSKNKFKNRNRS